MIKLPQHSKKRGADLYILGICPMCRKNKVADNDYLCVDCRQRFELRKRGNKNG